MRRLNPRTLLAAVGLTIGVGLLVSVFEGNRVKFGIGVARDEYLSLTNAVCFRTIVTNHSSFVVKLNDIRFEWRDAEMRVNNCAPDVSGKTSLKPGTAVVVRALIPAEARQFRVQILCKGSDSLRKLVAQLPLDRCSWLQALVEKAGLTQDPKPRSYYGRWESSPSALEK